MKIFIVWNESRTTGIVTTNKFIAEEIAKGNCGIGDDFYESDHIIDTVELSELLQS